MYFYINKRKIYFFDSFICFKFKKETMKTSKKNCAKIDRENFQFPLKLLFVLQSQMNKD